MQPLIAIAALWAAWLLSWFLAALWSARTAKRPAFGDELAYRLLTLAGFGLLFGADRAHGWLSHPGWPVSTSIGWLLAAITAAGFAFCWWARIHLGRLWSSEVTRKEGHRIIDTGPYGLVRHPIYTGIVVASFATALARGSFIAIAGAAVMTLGWYIKARLEERFLRAELGAEAYDAYARRTPMLVPLLKL